MSSETLPGGNHDREEGSIDKAGYLTCGDHLAGGWLGSSWRKIVRSTMAALKEDFHWMTGGDSATADTKTLVLMRVSLRVSHHLSGTARSELRKDGYKVQSLRVASRWT